MHALATKLFARYPRKSIRLLEIIPPLSAVFMISMPFWGAIFFPLQLAYFIIFFNMYWLYKSVNLAICAFLASRKIKEAEKIDWLVRAKALPKFNKMGHIVIVPTYQESLAKIKETIESIENQTFPIKRIFIFVAFEEREKESKTKAHNLLLEYKNKFGAFYCTFHPDDPVEVRGKSSNQAYAARFANKILEEKRINTDFLTVSSVDALAYFFDLMSKST